MEWFKRFYDTDYYEYRYAPQPQELPAKQVEFIIRAARLNFEGPRPPRVFDICCGTGRHARPLAARGCEVIGVDLSQRSIQAAVAQARAARLGDRCRFHVADIRNFTPPSECDAAISIFQSFGYFESDAADAIIMDKAAESLRPGGRFILDVINREVAVGNFKPRDKRGRWRNYVLERSQLDLQTGHLVARWTFMRHGRRSEHTVRIRLYALHELIHMAEARGLRFEAAYGDFDGRPYGRQTPRCIFVAEKTRPPH